MSKKTGVRVESDHLGQVQIPADVYWGANTQRARECFSISGCSMHPRMVAALTCVKKAASQANGHTGLVEAKLAQALSQAADEILSGMWPDNFVVDAFAPVSFQTGNLDELIANRASEMLGGEVGTYTMVHPDKHSAAVQSPQDIFSTAMRIAVLSSLKDLSPIIRDLERLLRRKALEFDKPAQALSQDFNTYASSIQHNWKRLTQASNNLLEVNLSVSDTTIAKTYAPYALEKLRQSTGLQLKAPEDSLRPLKSMSDFVEFSAALKELAIELARLSSDLTELSTDNQITVPPVAARDQLLPSEPVIPEALHMVAFQIISNDSAVTLAAQSGQLQSNSLMPLIIHNVLDSMDLLSKMLTSFNQRCLNGILSISNS